MKIEGENLVTKAVAAARKRAEIPPLDVELEKFFPAGSGIGAGSGNAGAMLKLLAAEYGAQLSPEETAKLGADVAFLASDHVMAEGARRRRKDDALRAALRFPLAPDFPQMELRHEGSLREAGPSARGERNAARRGQGG